MIGQCQQVDKRVAWLGLTWHLSDEHHEHGECFSRFHSFDKPDCFAVWLVIIPEVRVQFLLFAARLLQEDVDQFI